MDFPYVFNVPYKRLYNNSFTPIKINDCLQVIFRLIDIEMRYSGIYTILRMRAKTPKGSFMIIVSIIYLTPLIT